MKKGVLFFLLFSMGVWISCEDDSLNVTESKTVPADEYWFEITVTVTGVGWNVSKCPDWITLDPKSGITGETNVKVNVQENPETKQRRGYVRFSFGDVLEVIQEGR